MATTTASSSSSSGLLAALSASGSHVAVVLPSNNNNNSSLLRIQVFQTTNSSSNGGGGGRGTLQTTLTHRTNNNASSSSSSESSSLPVEIFWSGNDKICLLTSSNPQQQQVLVFDLTRGVLAHTISFPAAAAAKGQILHHAASAAALSSSSSGILQVLVSSSSSSSQESGGGGKIQIHEYDASSGKLLRKIKAGSRHEKNADSNNHQAFSSLLRLAVTTDHVIVREGNQLRILKADTGEKVTKKCKLFSSKKCESSANAAAAANAADGVGATVAMGQVGAAVVSASRQVVLVDLKTGKIMTPTSPTSLPSSSSHGNNNSNNNNSLQLWSTTTGEESSSLYYYLYHDKVLYKLETTTNIDGKTQVVEVKSKRKIQLHSSIEKQVVLGHGDNVIAVLYKAGQIQLNKTSLLSSSDSTDDDVALTWNDPESSDNNTAAAASSSSSSSTKRKSSSTSATHVLGPGQAGGESRTVSEGPPAPKRAKKEDGDDDKEGDEDDKDDEDDEDNQGPTIAERLQKLEQALHAEEEQDDDDDDEAQEGKNNNNNNNNAIKFHPKKATTESLTQILEQALQSNDKAMLELALTVTNKRILQATCASLQTESLSKLLSALTTRLAQKPTRAVQLSFWLTVVLKSVGRLIQNNNNNNNNIGQLLQPLRNLLDERVELFPTFYKLRGRLGMMGNLQE